MWGSELLGLVPIPSSWPVLASAGTGLFCLPLESHSGERVTTALVRPWLVSVDA